MNKSDKITPLLLAWKNGEEAALEDLAPLVYGELQHLANRLFKRESSGHTLEPTALVNEVFARLINAEISWQDRAHFYAVSARMMRRLLINHAKSRASSKRGGDMVQVTFVESQLGDGEKDVLLVNLADALDELAKQDKRKAELIDLYYFGGLTVKEIEYVTGLSPATIGRDLRFARAWLFDELRAADK